MRQKLKACIGLLLLMAAANLCYGQYINKLYDCDSSYNWGWNIFVQPDNNYFIVGWAVNETAHQPITPNLEVSPDGQTILTRHEIKLSLTTVAIGGPGQTKKIPAKGYLVPASVQTPNVITGHLYSAGGLLVLDEAGDSLFLKTFTDTSAHYDFMNTCAVMPDKGYIIGGERGLNIGSIYPAYIIRTDSMGDTLWTHTYQKNPAQWATINTIEPLGDGRILVGASTIHHIAISSTESYDHRAPWFMILDSLGNILKDTVYSSHFIGGGAIYKDKNGGYIHIGDFDSIYYSFFLDNPVNFPSYIAHLDSDFRVTWITPFTFSEEEGHRQRCTLRQLHDSTYLVVGDAALLHTPANIGWAAKIGRTGHIIWSREYFTDTIRACYLRDAAERADGSIIMIGAGTNDTLPAWHGGQDAWLLGIDSNGCELPGCTTDSGTTAAASQNNAGGVFALYPNPTSGSFTISSPASGTFVLYTLLGQEAKRYSVQQGHAVLALPAGSAAGMYIGRYKPADGSAGKEVRIIYQP